MPDLDYARSLLGQQVRVVLNEDDVNVVVEGKLLGVGDDGDVEILEDAGYARYCWPMLKIETRKES